jgi:hypothetical protein
MVLKLDSIKDKKKAFSVALLAVSLILILLMAVKLHGFVVVSARAGSLVKKAKSRSGADSNDVSKRLAEGKAIASELKRRNLFAPASPKENPVKQVTGIFGELAFINSRWYGENQNIGDAKVVDIEPTRVKVEWDGRESFFQPIMSADAGGGPERGGRPEGPPRPGGGPDVVAVGPQPQMQGQFGGPGGFDEMRQRFGGMRDRFMNMSPEERERFRMEMRERFGDRGRGRPGGDRGGPGGDRGGRRR